MMPDDGPIPGERYGRLARAMPSSSFFWDEIDPEWHELFRGYVERGMYSRNVLDQKTRELCAVAALVVQNSQGALPRHIRSALDYGASRKEVLEVVLQMSVYGGFPVTRDGLETLRATFAAIDTDAAAPEV